MIMLKMIPEVNYVLQNILKVLQFEEDREDNTKRY